MHFLVNTTGQWQRPVTVEFTVLPETVAVRCGSALIIRNAAH